MENIETLIGKYGDEGDKLIFKVLNNGLDNKAKEKQYREDFEKILQGKNTKGITERALKYDLTIPFARYVAMNYNQLTFPFKRYQIQPVWRADRPQKGRYREFYQCDADVVGSNALLNELELANIYYEVFNKLRIAGAEICINHRKLLTALAEICGGAERMNDIAVAIDKLDKTSLEKVKEDLSGKGFDAKQITIVEKYLSISGNNNEKLNSLKLLFDSNPNAEKGIKELEYLVSKGLTLAIDPALARGLNYYTGIIFEVKPPAGIKMGSIGGGGRYDNLTGLFGVPGIPGVGISFGVDRIYDVMEELQLFPAGLQVGTKVLFFNLGENESNQSFDLMQQLRQKGISAELYHEPSKFDKQFKYAEKKKIPYIVIIGEKELLAQVCNIKKLTTGTQKQVPFAEILNFDFS